MFGFSFGVGVRFSCLFLALGLLAHNTNAIEPVGNDNSDQLVLDFEKYYSTPVPIVILHGITSDTSELEPVVEWLKSRLSSKIYNIEIGNGRRDSIEKTMDWQLNELCKTIYNIPDLRYGFNFIGMSQGGLLARGYVERCNFFPVRNLITWVSPHDGVYGLNNINYDWIILEYIYTPAFQKLYSFTNYWKNPYDYETYLAKSTFLPYLNNESPNLAAYAEHGFDYHKNKEQLLSLENFVMIWSGNDDVITPPQSGKFEFYDVYINFVKHVKFDNVNLPVQNFFNSSQYVEDLLGLRTLYDSGRLHMLETNCTHSGHKTQACFPQLEELTFPFLV